MKAAGIVRKVDKLGRIVLSIELRRALDIEELDKLEIYLEGNLVILRKTDQICCFCGAAQALVDYKEKSICRRCLHILNDKAGL